MKKVTLLLTIILLSTSLSACFALQEPEASSGEVSAPTIAVVAPATDTPEPTAADPTQTPPGEPEDAQPTATEPAEVASGGVRIYAITPGSSEARFTIDEVLRGADTTVVGTTSNVAGQIALDMNDPSTAQIGEIVINARDLATDNSFRNRAIANEILHTNEYELITLIPKEIIGLPDAIAVGESYDLQVVADLTIIGQTQEVTFDLSVTPLSENELQGLASATIRYGDWGITVPLSQSVQAVADQVLLELEFVASAS